MKFFKESFFFIITLVFVILIFELFLKISHIAQPASTNFNTTLGRHKIGGNKYIFFNEGFSVVKYNNHGFIGDEIDIKKPKNNIRIALLGDSYVESFQVFKRDYFGTISENLLNFKNKKNNFSLLNFGRSGFNFSDMYIYQEKMVDKFNPNLIIYFISNSDLISTKTDPLLPELKIKNKKDIYLDYNFDKSVLKTYKRTKFLLQNFVLFNMTNIARKRLKKDYKNLLFGKLGDLFKSSKQINNVVNNPNSVNKFSILLASLDNKKVLS